MSQTFETGCSTIDLSGTPWNTTTHRDLYVEYKDGVFSFYQDSACQTPCDPPELLPPNATSVGLRFYLVDPGEVGVYFDSPMPITWGGTGCPSTITYGKILTSKKAFSMKDEFSLPQGSTTVINFDLRVYVPGTGVVNVTDHLAESVGASLGSEAPVEKVDPTIVESGEEEGY